MAGHDDFHHLPQVPEKSRRLDEDAEKSAAADDEDRYITMLALRDQRKRSEEGGEEKRDEHRGQTAVALCKSIDSFHVFSLLRLRSAIRCSLA